MTRSILLKDIGIVNITRTNNIKRLKISVRPFEGVNVLIPNLISFSDAEKFIELKKEWIRRSVERTKKIEKNFTVFDETITFCTRDHELKTVRHEKNTLKIIIKNSTIFFYYPFNTNIHHEKIQKYIRKGVEEAWRIEAKKYLPEQVKYFSQRFDFHFKKVSVKNAKSRWGSCSSDNNINLNLQLMRLPQQLCDYVILHELVHTVHKNHGKKFWELLDKVTGDARKYDNELKNYHLSVW